MMHLTRQLRPHAARRRPLHCPTGFTLLESMVLLVVISIVAVGVGVGLQSAERMPETTDRALAISAELNSEIENWRSIAWGNSPWPAGLPYNYTDNVSLNIGGQVLSFSRSISIQSWDPNNLATNASPQADFAQIKIVINGQTAISYVTKPI